MDLEALAASLTGAERMIVLCSPHNPGGRVWSRDELRALADFAAAHDLLLVSDEIHHDLVLGADRHVPMPLAAPDIADRLVMLTAATKTFNLAGALTGNVIIPDPTLRSRFAAAHLAAGTGANRFGMLAVTAAYAGRRRLARRAPPLPRRQRRAPRRGRRRDPRRPPDAARFHLPRLGRLRRHRHGAGRVHRPRRARRPHRRQPRARPSAPAARASCASTSPPRAPASRRRSAACRPPSPTCSRGRNGSPLCTAASDLTARPRRG